MLSLKLRQKASQGVLCKVVIKEKAHIITDIEEDCSECDEQETSATENSMETLEKLFTTESELNIINKRSRPGQQGKKLLLTAENETDVENQRITIGPDGTVWKEIDGSPKPGGHQFIIFLGIC